MASALVPDTLWEIVEPLLPLPKPKPQGGRPRMPDRVCLRGIVFVLRSGIRAAFAGAPDVNFQATLCSSELRRLSVLLLSPRVIDASLELSG